MSVFSRRTFSEFGSSVIASAVLRLPLAEPQRGRDVRDERPPRELVPTCRARPQHPQLLARQEVGLVLARRDRAAMVEGVVTGTVLGEAVLTALRRLAQEHTSASGA